MSLKAIEMQVVLPRTLDAGKIQEQMLKQGQGGQLHEPVSIHSKEKEREPYPYKGNSIDYSG